MTATWTRRNCLKALGLSTGAALLAAPARALATADAAGWDRAAIEGELRRRAAEQLRRRQLIVDYYRIRMKLAYPLPVASLSLPDVQIPSVPNYPWATWMLWALEERLLSLGWAAEWLADASARAAATVEVEALARWPAYRQYPQPDLSAAHAARILSTALASWTWPDAALRNVLRQGCARHVESVLGPSDKLFSTIHTADDVLRSKTPHTLLHNIPLIGTIGAALTAHAAGHAARGLLSHRVKALFLAILELRKQGYCEGVGYDGYVLDFAADWLHTLPEAERAPLLDHPQMQRLLEQSYLLSAPGAVEEAAELSDVEPREMPFHLSAQAKLLRLRPLPDRVWLLERCRLDWLRADGLAALRQFAGPRRTQEPAAGARDAHYALVLRSGWRCDDLAVAASCTDSPMGHLQADGGTLVIGSAGKWLIADPGYQQYMKGDEREFTIGPTAHNTPVLGGCTASLKRPRRLALETLADGVQHAAIDLTACYVPAANVKSAVRHVWLSGKNLVVAADCVSTSAPVPIKYHWHGHPAAAWRFDGPWAALHFAGTDLCFSSPQMPISGACLQRLPGSRGQLSLIAARESAAPTTWWVFFWGGRPPALQASADGQRLTLRGRTFCVN